MVSSHQLPEQLPDKLVSLVMGIIYKSYHTLPKSYLNIILAAYQNSKTVGIYGAPYETRTRVSGVRVLRQKVIRGTFLGYILISNYI